MHDRTDRILAVLALLAAMAVWFPALPWPLAVLVILPAAAFVPGRAVLGGRGGDGSVMALSILLVAATGWILSLLPGGPALGARLAVSLWLLGGAWLIVRSPASGPESRPDGPGLFVALAVTFLAVVPAAVNPALLHLPEARLFLPLMGEMQGGAFPPTNPFLVGAPLDLPWMFAALAAPFRRLTSAPAPFLLLLLQVLGLITLMASARRWTELRGGGRWAGFVLPALLAGGLTLVGFRNLPGLAELEGPGLAGAPFLRALAGLTGDPAVAGLIPRAWGASGLVWALGCAAAAGALAEERRFRTQAAITGVLLGAAILLHPAVGLTATVMWAVLRLAGGPDRAPAAGGGPAFGRVAGVLVSLVVAVGMAGPYLNAVPAPLAELPRILPDPVEPRQGAALLEALPLFLLAAAALAARRDRRGWIAALAAGALWGVAFAFSPAMIFAFLWSSLLFAGIPAALGLERLAGRLWGPPVIVAITLLLLGTPAAMAWQAALDRSGETRWSDEERAMFARADRTVPGDAVVLTLPTTRTLSEELTLLPRAAYLGPAAAAAAWGAPEDSATARTAEERGRRVSELIRGRAPVAVLDRMAAEVAPRPLVFVVSSEDAARHRDLLEYIYPTAIRFRPLENSETLKILLYEGPEEGPPAPGEAGVPPRIILRPDTTGTVRADTIGTIVDTLGAPADTAGNPPGPSESPVPTGS